MKFAPQEPADTLATKIKDLADIAKIAGSPSKISNMLTLDILCYKDVDNKKQD